MVPGGISSSANIESTYGLQTCSCLWTALWSLVIPTGTYIIGVCGMRFSLGNASVHAKDAVLDFNTVEDRVSCLLWCDMCLSMNGILYNLLPLQM